MKKELLNLTGALLLIAGCNSAPERSNRPTPIRNIPPSQPDKVLPMEQYNPDFVVVNHDSRFGANMALLIEKCGPISASTQGQVDLVQTTRRNCLSYLK